MKPDQQLIGQLQNSPEPSVRYLLRTGFLGEDPSGKGMVSLRQQIKESPRVRKMLSHWQGLHPYQKWSGAHWVLALLADLGYPAGEKELIPLREAELAWLLETERLKKVPIYENRYRRCASQESNAVFALVRLGLVDERVESLVNWLMKWQWPDGGWNCDKHPEAHVSSFTETLIPLRGLIAYQQFNGNAKLKPMIDRAAEVFLSRHLYRRIHDRRILAPAFVKLHYPCYWHYDILFGLKVMAEGGCLGDPRCSEAFDLLEQKQLSDGSFRAEEKYWRLSEKVTTGTSAIEWGATSTHQMNEFVTVDGLAVLKKAGRIL